MKLDLQRFFKACNPSKTLSLQHPQDRKYYVDCSTVRGGKIVEALGRTITLLAPDEPTCQLFTGHIGCGKSTELLRLQSYLGEAGFHTVYFESSQDLDMADLDVTDILLAIARSISESLSQQGIKLQPGYFASLFNEIKDLIQTPIDLSAEAELSLGIAKITARTRESPQLREQLRQHLEPRTQGILKAINEEILGRAILELRKLGRRGIVVIVDNLDRVDPRLTASGRSQQEYLFIDRGAQLRSLNCHVVYTLPLALSFSNEFETMKNRLGGGIGPKVLPMVPVVDRQGRESEAGMALMRQLVMARAFPQLDAPERLALIAEVFDDPATLDRLCKISGGHVRNLLGLLYNCLQQDDPPVSRSALESVIKNYRDDLALAVDEQEWQLLAQVAKTQTVKGDHEYQILLRSLFVFEYRDEQGRWFSVNPALLEIGKLQEILV